MYEKNTTELVMHKLMNKAIRDREYYVEGIPNPVGWIEAILACLGETRHNLVPRFGAKSMHDYNFCLLRNALNRTRTEVIEKIEEFADDKISIEMLCGYIMPFEDISN